MKIQFKDFANEKVIKEWEFNPSQDRFWKADGSCVLFSGGFGSGKSLALTLKAIEMALKYPNNYILMGRRSYPELRDTLWKEFFDICPEHLIANTLKNEMRVIFTNGTEIVFRHLDKIAEGEIRSMNLGQAFIDQAEDIGREIVLALRGRLRREGINDEDRKIFLSSNPKLTWLYVDFKESPQPGYVLIEASTLENSKNLPKSYVQNLLTYPESWKRQFVYGIWDKSLLSDKIVFSREYVERLMNFAKDPIRTIEGLEIYKEFDPSHKYQMGIDPSEGISHGDECSVTIVDLTNDEEAASWSGYVPPDFLAEKCAFWSKLYETPDNRILLVPEMNSIGVALVNKLKEFGVRMYRRMEEDKIMKVVTEKLGWRMTSASKPLLISSFQAALRLRNPRIYSRRTLDQFRSFVFTDEAHQNGMGAELGFHDDRLISALLAFWQPGKVEPGGVSSNKNNSEASPSKDSFLEVKAGKVRFKNLVPQLQIEKKWTM